MVLRLDPALAERLAAVAEVEGRTVSDVAREAIAALVEARRQGPAVPPPAGGQPGPAPAPARPARGRPAMITLDVADLAVIAGRVLGISPRAALDRLDLAAAQAALAETQVSETKLVETGPAGTGPAGTGRAGTEPAGGRPADDGPADAALAATVLIRALLRHRPIPVHYQQVAVAVGLQFLALNGWQADLDPPGASVMVIEGLASGRLSPADAAAWLLPRLSSSAPPAREKPMRTRLRLRALDPRPRAGVHTPVTGFMAFTDDACDVVVLARAEADRLDLDLPGPEQFLLALAGTDQGVAARALKRLGISPQDRAPAGRAVHRSAPAAVPVRARHPAGHAGHAAGRGRGGGPRPRLHRDRAHPAGPVPGR